MMKQQMKFIHMLKSAIAQTLIYAMVWNLLALPIVQALTRDRRSSKPFSKVALKSAKPATALQGQTMVVWGPQQIVRQPINTTYTASFSLPSGALPPYQMTVSNGAPNGTMKVTQACIQLNGVNVLSPTCYHNLNPTPQVRTVSLQASNSISVSLVGSVLTYITITITANQASLAVSPTSGTQSQTLNATLTGTGTNWVNGQTTASFGGEITVNSVTVSSATSATANITISSTAALGPRTVTTTTGSEVVSGVDIFTVSAITPPGSSSSTVSTLAGSAGNPGFADGTGATARFRSLAGIAAAPPSTLNDTVYVADAGNHAIRKVEANGAVTTIAGSGSPGFSDGQGTFGTFNNPQGVAVDSLGNVYVADTGNHSIRKVDASGNVTTIAGDGTAGFTNGTGAAARFNAPRGVAVDSSGRVYVADTGNHAVRRIETNGSVVTIAGNGTAGSSNGTGASARFNGLAGITVDGQTVYVYIADTGNHQIRRLDTSPAVILLAGLDRGFKDGTAAQSRFADPVGIATDGAGHIVIAETTNSLLREVDPVLAINSQPNAVYTLAGTGGRGTTDGAGNVAQFNKPSGVAVLTSSTVIVADTGNNTLRKVLLPPVIASLNPAQGNIGTAVTFTGNRFDERGPSYNTVRFAASGGTVNATVTSVTRSQINVTVPTGAVTGNVTVQTAGGTSNGVTFTVGTTQPPVISNFTPLSGPVGTLVTITGTNLMVGATNPAVTFAGANSTRLPAQIAFASATEVRATVPNATVTGVIQLTTSIGTATNALPFTVAPSQDYSLTLAPSSQTVVQGSTANFVVSATSPQTTFTQLISLTATGLPSGAAATFNPSQITAGATSTMSLKLSPSISPTSYSFTVQGVTKVDGSDLARSTGGSFTVMASGSTTLMGRVLSTDAVPIPGCSVSAPAPSGGDVTATTDSAGNFLLVGLQAGPARPIFIQPPTNTVYPAIKEPADVIAGQSNVVPYTFYLPAIDPLNTQINPNGSTDVTSTRVPGLKMTIPQGVRLRVLGSSADVTHVSITPVPPDRTPAPLPSSVATALVYTSQPGNSCIVGTNNQCVPTNINNGPQIPVTYPNLGGADPGAQIPLWAFDHGMVSWYQYGTGTVSDDGKTIAPNINPATGQKYGLRDFSWHFPALDPNVPWYDCLNRWGQPVQLSSGMKMESATDVAFGGERGGVVFTRIYTNDQAVAARTIPLAFGQWTHNYDIRLTGSFLANTGPGLAGRMAMPDQVKGPLFSYLATDTNGIKYFVTIGTPGQLGDLLLKKTDSTFEYLNAQGGKLIFNSSGRLTSIINANNNAITLAYTGNNLTRITDDVGRSITLAYDASNRVQTVTDPLNRVTVYGYTNGFLTSVTDPAGNVTGYSVGQ
ncbi:MAG: IPT/TIG domain-containing protein, partial [Acidobacteriota bacterium]